MYDKNLELKDIQTWPGQAGIETTAAVYTHISNIRKNSMAEDIQQLLQRKKLFRKFIKKMLEKLIFTKISKNIELTKPRK